MHGHAKAMHEWKKEVSRMVRRKSKQLIRTLGDEVTINSFPLPNEICTLWESPSDGKGVVPIPNERSSMWEREYYIKMRRK